ncbi:MAG: hypothetical protein ACKOTB_09925, partial [Planctomycetia bacterium]
MGTSSGRRRRRGRLACLVATGLLLALHPVQGFAKLSPEEVPTFRIRIRVVTAEGRPPAGARETTVRFGVGPGSVTAVGAEWSDWLPFQRPHVEATLKGYPAIYLNRFPIVVTLQVGPVADPTVVEAELKFDEADAVVPLTGELFGPRLGCLVWRDEARRPHAATMADYNRRYWAALEAVRLPPERRPKRFPIVDRFIGGDDDIRAWRDGIGQLDRAGFSAIMLPPDARIRDLLVTAGGRRTAWAVYSPPGYAFDFTPNVSEAAIEDWARQQAAPYRAAGYAAEDMALFAMSDEPGWYFPQSLASLEASPAALARFRDYLRQQGLEPEDVGSRTWEEVVPIGRSRAAGTDAADLPKRRLFYWSMRFFAHDSARHFARCTAALERAFYPGLPVLTNWNFFAGRLYVPGPVANNRDKESPDAAMGGHDWLEFGRLRGGTILWTEDWFGDGQAYQWSFYCAKLRAAAERGGVEFGGYVIPRTAGDRDDGILQKILCVVGSGGKAIKYFVFGPEYNFPGNCYSERAEVLPKMAEAHGMIGAAEETLWPGRRPAAEVAILAPRSAEMWDARGVQKPGIDDATNHGLNRATVDYLAEVFDLYLALQHANVPVDFVDEDDLAGEGIRRYRVLYVTEPNVPVEGQRGLAAWVAAGGTLVTVPGAAARDRYDDPSTEIDEATGMARPSRERLLIADTRSLPDVAEGTGAQGGFVAVGARERLPSAPEAVASFADASPAVVVRPVGDGRVVHFAWFPGLSYWKSSRGSSDGLPAGFSASIRSWIVWPTGLAGVRPPVTVDHPLVETPLLRSEAGHAITLLNWTGSPLDEVRLSLRLPEGETVRSV